MTIWTTPRSYRPRTLDEFEASTGEMLGAVAGETFAELPVLQASKLSELQTARGERDDLGMMIGRVQGGDDPADVLYGQRPEIPRTPIEDARRRVTEEGLDGSLKLPDGPDIPTPALDIMLDRARDRRQREQVIARGPQGFIPGALSMGTSFLVGAIDPLNIASAFIPVVGELRYGKMLADAGTRFGRAGVAAGVGAASGAVGVAALQPLDAYSRTLEGQDWHFTHSLQNVLFGAALGGVLMGGGRVAGDVWRSRTGRPLYPFDVGELLDAHPAWSTLAKPVEHTPLAGDPFYRGDAPNLPEQFPGFDDADLMPTPAAATIADLPPRAQEDAMRVAVAALVNGEPVRAGEMLQAAAAIDPRIAESFEAWHGSPHMFDAFSLDRIGTGEGIQAYGNGLYFAENPAVAGIYRNLAPPPDVPLPSDVVAASRAVGDLGFDRVGQAIAEIRSDPNWMKTFDVDPSRSKEEARFVEVVGRYIEENPRGAVYRVRIRANRDHFLDWDKPLSEQSQYVQDAVRKAMRGIQGMMDRAFDAVTGADRTGSFIHTRLSTQKPSSPTYASDVLREAGIPGIKYLDQGSRAGGEGTRNIVLFDDKLVDILERNGEPVRPESPAIDPEAAWRELSAATPAHSTPEVLAAAEAAAKLEPPPSTVPFDPQAAAPVRQNAPGRDEGPAAGETRTSGAPDGKGNRGPLDPEAKPPGEAEPRSVAARAARDAERRVAELYEQEVAQGYIDAADRAALNETLNRIDQETAARAEVIRQGAACLLAGFGAGAV